MALLQCTINGNPNVGLYGYVNNSFGIIGLDVSPQLFESMQKIFKVPLYHMNICGTSLVGVFLCGNKKTLLVPPLIMDHEKKQLERHQISYTVIPTPLTALGNNILCNDNGALVNPEFSARVKKIIRQALDVPLKPGTIADLETVGSQAILNSNGCLVNQNIGDEELEYVHSILNVPLCPSSVNLGNPYIRSGILANDHGMVISQHSSGIEAQEAEQCLGLTGK